MRLGWLLKSESHKSPGTDQIPAAVIKADGRIIRSEIHRFIVFVWNKAKLLEEWNESIIVHIYKKCDKTDCSDNRFTPYADEIIGARQC